MKAIAIAVMRVKGETTWHKAVGNLDVQCAVSVNVICKLYRYSYDGCDPNLPDAGSAWALTDGAADVVL